MKLESDHQLKEFLLEVWRQALNVTQIESSQSYFKLGGDSMSVVTMLVRVSGELDLDLDYEEFFVDPCIERLASIIRRASTQS